MGCNLSIALGRHSEREAFFGLLSVLIRSCVLSGDFLSRAE